MSRGIKRRTPSSELKDQTAITRILIRIRSNTRRPRAVSDQMEHHAARLLHLYVGREVRSMVRTVVGYSPAGDLKDHHELARVLARLRSGGMKQPQKVVEEMVHHASALLKLFADDATMGVVVPELEVEAAKDRRNKQRREQALQEALAGRP